jgi:dipeptidyl aminopeptidase/acylaminoacyl peptidase
MRGVFPVGDRQALHVTRRNGRDNILAMRHRVFFAVIVAAGLVRAEDQKAIQLPDILAWKRIVQPVLSADGEWFAYKLTPNDGNSEVVIRSIKDGKEMRFATGEQPRPAGGFAGPPPPPPRDLQISEDSKWAAFLEYPTQKEAAALRKQRKPAQSKLFLVELATGNKKEFDKIRRFSFSGERSSVMAMQRYAPTPATPPGPPAGANANGPSGPSGANNEDRPQGSDLIVYNMAAGSELNFGNVSDFAFDKPGNWLAWIIDAQDKEGNGIQAMNLATGAIVPLDSSKASYKGLTWTEKGDGLASVRGVEDKAWEDKVYTLVAFRNFSAARPEKIVFDPAKDSGFPQGMTVSPDRNPFWMADLSAVTFGIHELRPKKADADKDKATAKNDDPDLPDMVVWNWKDKRLQPMQQVQETRDRAFSYLCVYRPAEKKFVRLSDEDVRNVTATPESKVAMGVDIRAYEREENLDGKRYEDVYAVNLQTGERKLALPKARYVFGASPDGTHVLYYDDGTFYTFDLANGQSYNVSKQLPSVFIDTEDDHNVVKPPRRPLGWSSDSKEVLLSDGWDIWKAPAHGGPGVNLTVNGKQDKIRYQTHYRLDPDEKGIDLSKPQYFSAYGEWTKKGGVGVVEPGQKIKMLAWDDAHYQTILKAKHAGVFLYTRETNQEYGNFYASNAKLESGRRITDADPQQKNFLWTKGVRLIDYTSDKGDKLQGALYLPADYQPGKTYPAIVYIYEKLSQGANMYPFPGFNGFSISNYTSNGYAVLTPDIVYKVNDPGMSAVWCLVPAVKAAVATGVVDAKRVALHGHSWGGYQTSFTVTQTNIFHAAIAGAPLTDMIAMYNAIYWNTGSANQPIFESSQGRFTSGPWDNLEAYQRNSPVYHAKNIQTPLLILHNDKDGAVDWTQGIEYFNTLRRLGKPVVLLEYKGENHGLRKPENMKDYTTRMKEFFDYQLKDRQPPKWWTDGVPLLQQKDDIEQRTKQITSGGGN